MSTIWKIRKFLRYFPPSDYYENFSDNKKKNIRKPFSFRKKCYNCKSEFLVGKKSPSKTNSFARNLKLISKKKKNRYFLNCIRIEKTN